MIEFSKYQGAGNDFILIDNRSKSFVGDKVDFAKKWCDRKFGIGSDGIIFIEAIEGLDFEMDFYNPDGSQSFCGNGSRCAVSFAQSLGIIDQHCFFRAVDGDHEAKIIGDVFHILMADVNEIDNLKGDYRLNTGSPHYIKVCGSVSNIDVVAKGREIRYNEEYSSKGINVNFIEKIDSNGIRLRTYERGVENETLACGTGATAAALAFAAMEDLGKGTVDVKVEGGELKVSFEKQENAFVNVWLIGPAVKVFKGTIDG